MKWSRLNNIEKCLSMLVLIVGSPLWLFICLVLVLTFQANPVFRQHRVGKGEKLFVLYKFRTMPVDTRDKPTHMLDSSLRVNGFVRFLRRFKLDEIPQLFNVVRGEMSLVGPRPCLPCQTQLIELRRGKGLYCFEPGITGPAQIRGLDMSNPMRLVEVECLIKDLPFKDYILIIASTILGRGLGDAFRG